MLECSECSSWREYEDRGEFNQTNR